MKEITSTADFTASTSTGSVLVDFWAPWCGPCKALAPTLEAIEISHPNTQILKVNIDTTDGQVISSQLGIQSVPTLIYFQNGKKSGRLQGNVSAKKIIGLIQ